MSECLPFFNDILDYFIRFSYPHGENLVEIYEYFQKKPRYKCFEEGELQSTRMTLQRAIVDNEILKWMKSCPVFMDKITIVQLIYLTQRNKTRKRSGSPSTITANLHQLDIEELQRKIADKDIKILEAQEEYSQVMERSQLLEDEVYVAEEELDQMTKEYARALELEEEVAASLAALRSHLDELKTLAVDVQEELKKTDASKEVPLAKKMKKSCF